MDGSKFSFELYLKYCLGIIFLPAHTLFMMYLSHHYKFIAVFDIFSRLWVDNNLCFQHLTYCLPGDVQFSLSVVSDFATPWIAAHQASLSITNSWSSLKLMSIESVMPSSHLILCHPLLLLTPIPTASESFPMSQLFSWGVQSTGVSALASFLPK